MTVRGWFGWFPTVRSRRAPPSWTVLDEFRRQLKRIQLMQAAILAAIVGLNATGWVRWACFAILIAVFIDYSISWFLWRRGRW